MLDICSNLIKAEILLDFSLALLGEIKLPGIELSLPALPGLEYPDPGGSGLNVPVLGAQLDWLSGCMVPLAGTMEDADGKGNGGFLECPNPITLIFRC